MGFNRLVCINLEIRSEISIQLRFHYIIDRFLDSAIQLYVIC